VELDQSSTSLPQSTGLTQRRVRTNQLSAWAPRLLLLLILLLGAYFRTMSITDWDSGTGQHPDERFFTDISHNVRLPASPAEFYDSARSPLNPRNYNQFPFFAYGPLPVTLTRVVAVALTPNDWYRDGQLVAVLPREVPSLNGPPRTGLDPQRPDERRTDFGPPVPNPERAFPKLTPLQWLFNPDGRNLTEYGQIVKVGRSLAAVFDLASLVLIYLIGRRLFGVRSGLLAALLSALTVMQIQQSHFFVDPIFSTFFCLLALYWAVRIAEGGSVWNYVGIGLSIGAAMASRITLATLGLMAIVAAVIAAGRYVQNAESALRSVPSHASRPPMPHARLWLGATFERFVSRELPLLFLAGALTLFGFRALSPDAFTGSIASSPVMVGERPLDLAALQGWGFFDIRPDPRFIGSITTVASLVSGEADFPPSQQWVGRPAYVFPWTNMVLWGMGPALGLAAWGAWAVFGLRGLRRLLAQLGIGRGPADSSSLSPAWVLFAWVLFYFAWQGGQFAITMRYLLPIYGSLTIFAAWGLWRLWEAGTQGHEGEGQRSVLSLQSSVLGSRFSGLGSRVSALGSRLSVLGSRFSAVLLPLVLIATLGWAYAFSRIYTQPHSRVMAAQWLADNAPSGSYVMAEIWDDPLPLQVTSASWGSTFQGISSAPYAEDELRKWFGDGSNEGLLDQLDRADYITLTSNRVYDSTSRLPMRYPALMRYYNTLFSGELGFELAAEITSYPQLFGVDIPDYRAEEAFSVYDHPRVLIFAKTPAYSRERAEALITNEVLWGEIYKSPVSIADRNSSALRLTDSQWPRYTEGGTWSALFNPTSLVNLLAPLAALVVLQLLGLAVFALLFPLLGALPDRGYSLAKVLGLLIVAYAAWMLGSLRLAPFTPLTLWLCAAPLLIAGATVAYQTRDRLRAFWQARRTALLSAELIFLGFFALGLLLRWLNPDLWHPSRGGEKPMDFAYLNAVLKSAAFPPYDPWHAGGYINYYYFGFVIVGALIHLTTIVPAIGYNVAVAAIFGLTALGAWGVVYNLLANRHTDAGQQTPDAGPQTPALRSPLSALRFRERRALIAAGLAPLFMLLLGNLAQAIWYLNGYAAEQASKGRPEWAFWDATRIVPGTVNEFPFFTFLFADLHAHMIVIPLSLALLGFGIAWVRNAEGSTQQVVNRPLNVSLCTLHFALCIPMALLAGAIRVTNTWDYPTYVGLTGVAFALAAWRGTRALRRTNALIGGIRFVLATAAPLAIVIVLGNLFFAPFLQNFATESSGAALLREGLAPTLLTQILGAERTSAWELFRLYGHWLIITALAGLLLLRRQFNAPVALGLGGGLVLVSLVSFSFDWSAPVLLVPLLGGAFVLIWRLRAAPPRLLLPILWSAAGLGLALLVEFVVVQGDVGRLNTVFKFGIHSWTLFALSAAVAVPWLWREPGGRRQRTAPLEQPIAAPERSMPHPPAGGTAAAIGEGEDERIEPLQQAGGTVAIRYGAPERSMPLQRPVAGSETRGALAPALITLRLTIGMLLAAALVYPLTATPARLADRWDQEAPRTLDGTAFMERISAERNGQGFSLNEDVAAIAWLQRNVAGTPVIVEAHRPSYQWAGRVATFTGLPTILGWEWHQIQQRNVANASPAISYRQQTIAEIYNTPDPATALTRLRAYGVEYVYVGGMERTTYDLIGLAKFPFMAQQGLLEEVFSQGETQIYRVVEPGTPRMLTSDVPVTAPTAATPPPLLLTTPVNELPPVDEYAWNTLIRQHSPLATLLWLIVLYGLALLGLPLAHLTFSRWRDGGLAWARIIGLLLLGYAVWLPASLGIWQYDLWGVLFGLLLVVSLNALLLWQIGRADNAASGKLSAGIWRGMTRIAANLRACRRAVITGEAIFLGGFLAIVAIRAFNPDLWHPIWGGEKPMEFGFLNAILRSPVMPPYDPFFSDGYINYYYYGLYLVSLPIKLTGIAPAIGFNLAVATVFGLTLAGAFAIAAQLSGRLRYGLFGAALVAVAGNMAGLFAVGWSRGIAGIGAALDGGLTGLGARLGDWYIGPSRVIPYTINEFPFFTFLFADLHPHMIALPITLLAIALGYTFLTVRADDGVHGTHGAGVQPGTQRAASLQPGVPSVGVPSVGVPSVGVPSVGVPSVGVPSVGVPSVGVPSVGVPSGDVPSGDVPSGGVPSGGLTGLALLALTLGALAVTNSWDFPTYGLLAGMVLLGAAWRAGGPRMRGIPWLPLLRNGLVAIGVGVASLALYAPFFDRYHAFVGGVGTVPLTTGTRITDYLAVYGLFGVLLLAAVVGAALRFFQARRLRLTLPALVLAIGGLATVVAALAAPHVALRMALITLLLTLTIVLLQRPVGTPAWYGLLLAWLGMAVSLGFETVFIRDHLAGGDWFRMNTVFKFGMQVWILFALATATALPRVLRGIGRMGGPAAQGAALAVLIALGLIGAVYPLFGVPSRLGNRFDVNTGLTLDGLAFMREASFPYDCAAYGGCAPGLTQPTIDLSGDAAAIAWLNDSISGTPIVAQSNLWFYRSYGPRIAANTGLPTILSSLHADEQRDGATVARRERDVEQLFRSPDVETALRILARYRVNYLYVGAVEHALYPAEGIAKFDLMRDTYLDPIYDTPEVQIYAVRGIPDTYARPEPYDFASDVRPARRPAPAEPAAPVANDATTGLEALERAVAANPTEAALAFGLADLYRRDGRLDDAARVLEPAARANPTDIGLHHLWGDILADAARYSEAEAAYLQAARTDGSAGNWNKLGAALLQWGELDKAEIALFQAVSADPNQPEPYYRLAQLFAQRGDQAQAAEQAQNYLQLAPDGPWAAQAAELMGEAAP
jgi:YYY domain-containing protein